MIKYFKQLFIIFALLAGATSVWAQCPRLLNEAGIPTTNPEFLLCSKDPRQLFIDFDKNFGSYTINWGDGSPNTTGTNFTAGNPLSHNYAAGVNNYTITITIAPPTGPCTLTATVVKEEPTTASIQVPFGGVTRACAPATLDFVNSSTNNSSNTTYIWNFGDGTGNQQFGANNHNQTINHLYNRGTVDCGTKVTLTAFNKCNVRQGSVSVAEYSPILIWDLDKPAIASDTLFCYPDTVVTYRNATDLNCIKPGEGNVEPRTEYWRFIDFFGPGQDSIIDWRPFGPPRTIRYPGIGTYRVELRERSFCGEVNVFRTIRIIAAPVAGLIADKDTICIGEQVKFTSTTTGPANVFSWNPDDNTGWKTFPIPSQTIAYANARDYNIKLAVDVFGGSPSCKDTAQVPVVVVPNPVAKFQLSADKGCDSLTVNITNQSTGAATVSWLFGNGNASSLINPNAQKYSTPGRYFIDLFVKSAKNCNATTRDTIDVFKSPNVQITIPEVCQKATTIPINNTQQDAVDTVTTWFWQWGDGASSNGKNPTHTYASDGTYTVQLTANTPNCSGTSNALARINPLPTAAFTPDRLAGCSPLTVNFSNSSAGVINYNWTFGDGGSSTVLNPSHLFINIGPGNRNFNVKLVGTTAKACKDSITKVITVFPAVAADFSFVAVNNCLSLDVDFKHNSPGATNFFWDFGDGTTSTLPNPSHQYTNNSVFVADYDVKLFVNSANGCSDSIVKKVSVDPEAKFTFTASPDSGCSPLVVNFTAKAGAASYQWEFPDGTTANGPFVSKVFFNNGSTERNFDVKLTATTSVGCIDITQKKVYVFPDPSASFQVLPAQGCAPLTTSITNNSVGAISYTWDYGDGNTDAQAAKTFSYQYLNATPGPLDYQLRLTATSAFGCSNTSMQTVKVFPMLTADFDTVGAGCTPFSKSYLAKGGTSYFWNFGNGELANTASYKPTFVNSSNTASQFYVIKLIATSAFGCTDTVLGRVEVYPKPLAKFQFDKIQGCAPLDATITNQSVGANQYFWRYGDGETSAEGNTNHVYQFINNTDNPKDFQTSLVATNANLCSDTTMVPIKVFPLVDAKFGHVKEGCDPLSVTFFNTSNNALTYDWQIQGAGNSTSTEPKEVFRNLSQTDAFYNIRLVARSGFNCTDTAISQVRVFPKPQALFGLNNLVSCQPMNVNFTNNSLGATSYLWTYGQGQNSTTNAPLHQRIFINEADTIQKFKISLIATNSFLCNDTTTKEITVYPKVKALFDPIDPGCSPLKVEVKNRSIGASSISWNFNNESNAATNNASHSFVNAGVNTETRWVDLIAQNNFGCSDTIRQSFDVFAVPVANFLATPSSMRFPENTVTLNNTTAGISNWTYNWKFGDGDENNLNQPGNKVYATWGKYTISLSARSAFCEDTAQQVVEIIPPLPQANFEGGGAGCKPYAVGFTSSSDYAVSYFWDFGDGGTSEQQNPNYIYFIPGTYTVTLRVKGPNGEFDEIVRSSIVEVYDNAEAFFITSRDNARTNSDPVDFENLSKKADSYLWDFGDGNTSTEKNPTHFYSREGVFDITLIADNSFSCPDTFLIKTAIKVVTGDDIVLPTAFTPNPAGSNGGIYDSKSINNDVFFPFHKDVAVYKMEIFSRWGEKLFESNDVNIGWDGYYNNVLCQQDVYVYKVTAIFRDGKNFEKVGDVTLLR